MMSRPLFEQMPQAEHIPMSDPELAKLVPLLIGIVRQAKRDARSDARARAWLEALQDTSTKRVQRVA
jgi:hypothetical protein